MYNITILMSRIKLNRSQLTQSCEDDYLISKLKSEGKLNPSITYALKCPSDASCTTDKLLGTGTFNEVWSLENNNDQVLRITKLGMKTDYLEDEITGLFLQSYMSKSLNDGGIGCSNICKVYEFGYVDKGTTNERVYAILERVTTDLYEYLKRDSNNELINARDRDITLFGEKREEKFIDVKNIFKQVLEGLQCMHANNYVHLDIKPANIGIKAIDDEKKVKIFDFGMAMYIDPKNSLPKYNWFGYDPINATYQRGTPFYMDPFLSDKTYGKNFFPSKKSDVYSVGIMMLETYFSTTIDDDTGLLTFPVKHSKFNKLIGKYEWDEFYRRYYDDNEDAKSIKPDGYNNEHSPLKTLLKKMIDRNPDMRYTVDQVISHKWFTYDVKEQKGGKLSRKFKKNRSRKTIKKRRQSSFVKSRRASR